LVAPATTYFFTLSFFNTLDLDPGWWPGSMSD